MTVALMWEARAADGRGCELLEWARQQAQAEVSRAAADGTRALCAVSFCVLRRTGCWSSPGGTLPMMRICPNFPSPKPT